MGYTLSDYMTEFATRRAAARRDRALRRTERQVCEAHPDWTPLTKEELTSIDSADRWGYMVYKNMAPVASQLRYFITEAPYKTRLLPALNPMDHSASGGVLDCLFTDKNYAERFMGGLTFPKAVVRRLGGRFFDGELRPVSEEEARALTAPYGKLVFKQTVETGHGKGIHLAEAPEFHDLLPGFARDYVVQELVRQHEALAYFNPSSVNVVRVNTLHWRGDMYHLGSILRVGAPGAFCDHQNWDGKTYLTLPLDGDGTVLPRAYDIDFYYRHDDCHGLPIRGRIPRFGEIVELALREHMKYPQFRLIGWDFTVDDHGNIVCMEFNTNYPGMTGTQCALGPVFAQKSVRGVPLLDEILGGK